MFLMPNPPSTSAERIAIIFKIIVLEILSIAIRQKKNGDKWIRDKTPFEEYMMVYLGNLRIN